MFDTIGPVWDGNEVWLVVAGGATFAAFPAWYATMFSGFYLALLLVLVCLMVRVVSFEWREKSKSPRWRATWLWANVIGSVGAPLIWGIALANLAAGRAARLGRQVRGHFTDLFSAYTVAAGIATVLLFALHGAIPHAAHQRRAVRARAAPARRIALPVAVMAAAFLVWTVAVAHDRNHEVCFPPVACRPRSGSPRSLVAVVLARARQGLPAFAMTAVGVIALVATIFTAPLSARDGLPARLLQQPDRLRTPPPNTTRSS